MYSRLPANAVGCVFRRSFVIRESLVFGAARLHSGAQTTQKNSTLLQSGRRYHAIRYLIVIDCRLLIERLTRGVTIGVGNAGTEFRIGCSELPDVNRSVVGSIGSASGAARLPATGDVAGRIAHAHDVG